MLLAFVAVFHCLLSNSNSKSDVHTGFNSYMENKFQPLVHFSFPFCLVILTYNPAAVSDAAQLRCQWTIEEREEGLAGKVWRARSQMQ